MDCQDASIRRSTSLARVRSSLIHDVSEIYTKIQQYKNTTNTMINVYYVEHNKHTVYQKHISSTDSTTYY